MENVLHVVIYKTRGQYALIQLIDQWITEALEHAMQSDGFTQAYEKATFIRLFYCQSTRK